MFGSIPMMNLHPYTTVRWTHPVTKKLVSQIFDSTEYDAYMALVELLEANRIAYTEDVANVH